MSKTHRREPPKPKPEDPRGNAPTLRILEHESHADEHADDLFAWANLEPREWSARTTRNFRKQLDTWAAVSPDQWPGWFAFAFLNFATGTPADERDDIDLSRMPEAPPLSHEEAEDLESFLALFRS